MRKKILLVDDVRLCLEVNRSFLSRESVQLTIAQSGSEALKTARVLQPDLVIMDQEMPGMDGASCCRQLKADPVLGSTPVVLLISGRDREQRQRCLEAGCDELLAKPVGRQQLVAMARSYLELPIRATPRLPIRLQVRYGVEKQRMLRNFALNLGAGGFYLETPLSLPVGSNISFELQLPDHRQPVVGRGQVTWVNGAARPPRPDLPPGVGLQFSELSRDDDWILRQFLKQERLELLGGDD